MNLEQERSDFEKHFPVIYGIYWNSDLEQYDPNVSEDFAERVADIQHARWEAWLFLAKKRSEQEPVAFEYQHEETGHIGFVDPWQVEQGFFENNPRLQLIGPVYRNPS